MPETSGHLLIIGAAADRPSSLGAAGRGLYFITDDGEQRLTFWDGGQWRDVAPGLESSGSIPATFVGAAAPAGDVSACWPVGSVFISVVDANPAALLGFGTWSAIAAGRVLVGLDPGQAEFDALEKTGGAKTHALTEAEMPTHTHAQDPHNHVQNAHSHVITSQTATSGSATSYEHGTLDTSSAEAEATETTNPATAINQATTAINQSAGSGSEHNNLQPFLVVSMWKRTA